MLSASFYNNDEEVGFLQLRQLGGYGGAGPLNEFEVVWTAAHKEMDVKSKITRTSFDSALDLFAMALVEVDAILAERAVN